jgi:hypothetical protein
MGQVTIDNKIGHDIFGRHVNKAARVESQASGGQILATQTVVETLKGNLELNGVRFHEHGKVAVKGIKESLDVVEVLYRTSQVPTLPKGLAPKFLKTKILVPFLALFLASLVAVYFILNPKLYMYSAPKIDLVLNGEQVLNIKNIESQKFVEIDERIFIGNHILHYQVSSVVRYYTKFQVKPFMKYFKPKYKYVNIPSHDFYIKAGETKNYIKEKELIFKIPNKNMELIDQKVSFRSTQKVSKIEDKHLITLEYSFTDPNGKKVEGRFEKLQLIKDGSFSQTIKVGEDKDIEYSVYISFWGDRLKVMYRCDFKRIESSYLLQSLRPYFTIVS